MPVVNPEKLIALHRNPDDIRNVIPSAGCTSFIAEPF